MERFDAIVVGAGPAGTTAALVLARSGVRVALLERGAYPGAKNLMGGVLYTEVLASLVPDFRERGAPVERYVARRGLSILSAGAETALSFQTDAWDAPPHNHGYTVLRARFDRWYAGLAEQAGAELVCGVVVDRVLTDADGRACGVAVRMPEDGDPAGGELRAPVVILADGANSVLAEAAGLRPKPRPGHVALGIKETLALPRETIEDRFGLTGDQGAAWTYVGEATGGRRGAGFLYTNRDTVSVGLVVYAADLAGCQGGPAELLDHFKEHPAVAPRLRGAEPLEYGAHLVPEGGYDRVPPLVRDGLLLAGDAAGLVDASPRPQGANFAMASGELAARAVLEAREAGEFSAAALSRYRDLLADSFVFKQLEHHRDWPGFVERNPHVFASWPAALTALLEAALRQDGPEPERREADLWDLFQRRVGVLPFATTAVQLRNALRILGYGKTDRLVEYLARNW